jgi:sortase B
MEDVADNNVYEGVEQFITEADTTLSTEEIIIVPDSDDPLWNVSKYQQTYDWQGLLNTNKEIVSWLYVPNNDIINFPIVQGTDNSFYLNHDYTGKYNGNGAAFIDYRYNKFALNKIIYGHNMNLTPTKPIFTTIMSWKDQEYFDTHRELYYTDANGLTEKYLIVGIAHFDVSKKEEYSYLDMFFDTEEKFRGWVEYIKAHSSIWDLGVNTIDYRADEVITLSTCDRKLNLGANGRTILFCINLTNNELDGG